MKSIVKKLLVFILIVEAKIILARHKPIIVAVTGSVGKTSTKDAIYTVLKHHIYVRKSEKSMNSDVGVPLSVLGLSSPNTNIFLWLRRIIEGFFLVIHTGSYPKVLVLEIGVDHPGDMDHITAWLRPDVVVITRLPDVPVHVENFASPEEVIREKMKIVHALPPSGVIVYNRDDERVVREVEQFHQKALGFSRYARSAFTGGADVVIHEKGMPVGLEYVVNTDSAESVLVRVNGSVGMQHIYSYTAAIAVGTLFDVSIVDAAAALREHGTPPGRMKLIKGEKGTTLIDDSYNSSPTACEQAIYALGMFTGAKRRIAVLGDMLELGQYSVAEHVRIGETIPKHATMLVTVGVRARGFAEGALAAGMDEDMVFQYEDAYTAATELEMMLESGDVLLVKGSQGMRMERIVEELMAEPEKAEKMLVRQDSFWKKN